MHDYALTDRTGNRRVLLRDEELVVGIVVTPESEGAVSARPELAGRGVHHDLVWGNGWSLSFQLERWATLVGEWSPAA